MSYDVLIIGSGPGGYSAAVRAGQYGLHTALVEKNPRLGGTCLLVGCIPTKALLHTADLWEQLRSASGIQVDNPRLDYPKVIDHKNEIVTKHSKGVDFLMRKNKVDVIRGEAAIKGPGRVEVRTAEGVQTVEAKNIIVATGSEARMLPGLEPDPERILTNIEILDQRAIPKSLIVIGSGAVGSEFASMFQRFGAQVTLLEMLPRIVPFEDEEVSKELERLFKKAGIRVETGARAGSMKRTADGVEVEVTLANGKQETLRAEKVLVAVGRKPVTDNIGLETTRAATDRGFIKVDQNQQTAEPGLYAIGDVASPPKGARNSSDNGAVVANLDSIASGPGRMAMMNGGVPPTAVVYFQGDGFKLNKAAHAQVRAAVSAFKAGGGQGTIRVVGHASSRTANMSVEKHLETIFAKSQARADAVAQELIHEGVPAAKVLIDAVGDSQPVYYESMPKGESGNRRAEIFVQG